MKFSTAVLAAVAIAATAVEANSGAHDGGLLAARHARLARRSESVALTVKKTRSDRKRCKTRAKPAVNAGDIGNNAKVAEPEHVPAAAAAHAPAPPPAPEQPKPAPEAPKPPHTPSAHGVINVPSNCGDIGATREVTPTTGPNGSLRWLNCGLDGAGWTPQRVTIDDIVVVDLNEAIQQDGSPFKACAPFVGLFNQYAAEFGLRAIILASFAMQESSCNPDTVGGGGEQGLMQITPEKCHGAPNGNCREPWFNIRTGAKYFADTLRDKNGDFLTALGAYNGWQVLMDLPSATAAAHSDCCKCQKNVDYLHQFLNGWCQGLDAYAHGLGQYFNLRVCG